MPLSSRQDAILARLRKGMQTKQIARELGLSPTTVRHHIRLMFRKLGARNRIEAVYLAQMGTNGNATVPLP